MGRNNLIQIRKGSDWSSDPVLASGEPGFDIANNILKIGDGFSSWSSLIPIGSGLAGSGGGINNIIEDTTPQLGGDLDINSNNIVGTGHISISGDITAISGTLDVLSFNVDNESILTKGQISWDDTEGTMDIGLTDNTTIHIGEHRYFRIRNETGGVLYKGQVVYATGVHSNGLITPAKYVADGSIREVRFMGAVLEDVNNQNNGYVVDFGHLQDMDLDGSASNYAVGDETWVAGDILYVHPTVAGKLTKVEPKHSISVAIVLDPGNGNGNGRMFVRPTSYGHLDDNHDVNTSGVVNGQMLRYISSSDIWTTGIIYDNGTNVGIGTASPDVKLHIVGTAPHLRQENTLASSTISHYLFSDGANLGGLVGYGTSYAGGSVFGVGASGVGLISNNGADLAVGTFGGTGNIRLGTNGTEKVRIDGVGNVGIGTASPSSKLDVNGDITITDKIIHEGDTNTFIRFGAADTFSITTAGTSRIHCDASGRIGILNNQPVVTLDVAGPIAARSLITEHQTNAAIFDFAGGAARIRSYGATAGAGVIDFRTGGGGDSADAQAMRIDAQQNVGIGTISPSEKLDVNGKIKSTLSYTATHSATNLAVGWYTVAVNTGNRAIGRFGLTCSSSGRHQGIIFYASHFYALGNQISVLHNNTYSTSNPIAKLRIKKGGTYDGCLLQVYIDDAINTPEVYLLNDNINTDGWVVVDWVPDGTNPGGVANFATLTQVAEEVDLDTMDFGTTGQTSLDGPVVINEGGNNNDFRVEGDADANLLFTDASTDRVGIGTASPSEKLDVNGGIGHVGWKTFRYTAQTSGSGFTTSFDIKLNDAHGTTLNTLYYYKIRLTQTDTIVGGSTYLVWYNGGSWQFREVSVSSGSTTPLLTISGSKAIAYVNSILHLDINCIIETYFAGVLTNLNFMGSDFHWQRSDNHLYYNDGNVTINDLGGNYDFRVEGDTDANLLCTDASTDMVGIGINSPTAKLMVYTTGVSTFRLESSSSYTASTIKHNSSTQWGYLEFNNDSSNRAFVQQNGSATSNWGGPNALSMYNYAGPIVFGTNTTNSYIERMSIDTAGNIVINEGGLNSDFRVEGDTLTHLIHADASKDEVVIHNAIGYPINYATSEGWAEATGGTSSQVGYYGGDFISNGASTKNYINYSDLPNGLRGLVWQSRNNTSDNTADGGWGKNIDGLDPAKTYISVVYVRRVSTDVNSVAGTFYHGCGTGGTTYNLNNTVNNNPYFNVYSAPNLPYNVWCVSIGVIHANGDPVSTQTGIGGIYRLDTGTKIYSIGAEYRMGPGATTQSHRTYLFYDAVGTTELDWCWPGFYEINSSAAVNLLNTILYDHFSGRNITVNEDGGNFDFRVEGDTDQNLLFTDASTDRVGIQTSTPTVNLEIGSNTSTPRALSVRHSTVPAYISNGYDGTYSRAVFSTNIYNTSNGSFSWSSPFVNTNYSAAAIDLTTNSGGGGSQIRFYTATVNNTEPTERMHIDGDGNVGIGTATPSSKFTVAASNEEGICIHTISASAQNFKIGRNTSNGTLVFKGSQSDFSAYEFRSTIGGVSKTVLQTDRLTGAITFNDQFTFPTTDGSAGQSLVTDGAGNVAWSGVSGGSSNLTRGSFVLTQTSGTFTVDGGYNVGTLDVYYNGSKLLTGTDYSATNGSSFTLTNPAVSGDIVEYLALNAQTSAVGNTILGSVSVTSEQSVFNVQNGYTAGGLAVFLNGIKLIDTIDFSATNSTSFTLTSPASSGDIVDYIAYGAVVASTNLQKTGDTMTGNLTIGNGSDLIVEGDFILSSYKEGFVNFGNTGSAKTIDISSGTIQTCILTANCVFTMPNPEAGRSFTLLLKTGTGNFTSTFTNVKWSNDSAPTITTAPNKIDILTFVSDGTNWYGTITQNYSV